MILKNGKIWRNDNFWIIFEKFEFNVVILKSRFKELQLNLEINWRLLETTAGASYHLIKLETKLNRFFQVILSKFTNIFICIIMHRFKDLLWRTRELCSGRFCSMSYSIFLIGFPSITSGKFPSRHFNKSPLKLGDSACFST